MRTLISIILSAMTFFSFSNECKAQKNPVKLPDNPDFRKAEGRAIGLDREVKKMPIYMDPLSPVEKRVEDLLSFMTLEEKIGQMNMPCVYEDGLGKDVQSKFEGCRKFAEGTQVEGLGPGGGFFTLPNTILFEGPRQQAEFLNELQKIAIEKTRLHIPLLMTEEGTHGLMCSGSTIFPEGLAIGSTWNMDLVEDIYATAAREARAIGIHQLFTLVIEPNRDPRLGRNEEGYSEDPYLCSRIAGSIVRGVQGDEISAPDKVVAGLCHYPGQSQPVSGLERGAMEISERTAPRGISSALGGRYQKKRCPRCYGNISCYRRNPRTCFSKDPDRDTQGRARFRRISTGGRWWDRNTCL